MACRPDVPYAEDRGVLIGEGEVDQRLMLDGSQVAGWERVGQVDSPIIEIRWPGCSSANACSTVGMMLVGLRPARVMSTYVTASASLPRRGLQRVDAGCRYGSEQWLTVVHAGAQERQRSGQEPVEICVEERLVGKAADTGSLPVTPRCTLVSMPCWPAELPKSCQFCGDDPEV